MNTALACSFAESDWDVGNGRTASGALSSQHIDPLSSGERWWEIVYCIVLYICLLGNPTMLPT